MNMLDAGLWSAFVTLTGVAVALTVRGEPPWDRALFAAACLRALGGPDVTPSAASARAWGGDFATLPPGCSPAVRLRPGVTWEGLGATDAELARRLADVRLAWTEPPRLVLPGLDAAVVDDDDPDAFAPLLPRPSTRLVVAASGSADRLVRVLARGPGLRDRLRAVLLVAPTMDPSAFAAAVTHDAFDVELAHAVPWFVLRARGAPALPEPPEPPTGQRMVEVIDLGEVDTDDLGHPALGRALAVLLAALD